jgi:hypothetical protein
MSGEIVQTVETTGEEVNNFIKTRLGPAVDGQPFAVVNASMLTLILSNLGPEDMTEEELLSGVQEVSSFIVLYITGMRPSPGRVN